MGFLSSIGLIKRPVNDQAANQPRRVSESSADSFIRVPNAGRLSDASDITLPTKKSMHESQYSKSAYDESAYSESGRSDFSSGVSHDGEPFFMSNQVKFSKNNETRPHQNSFVDNRDLEENHDLVVNQELAGSQELVDNRISTNRDKAKVLLTKMKNSLPDQSMSLDQYEKKYCDQPLQDRLKSNSGEHAEFIDLLALRMKLEPEPKAKMNTDYLDSWLEYKNQQAGKSLDDIANELETHPELLTENPNPEFVLCALQEKLESHTAPLEQTARRLSLQHLLIADSLGNNDKESDKVGAHKLKQMASRTLLQGHASLARTRVAEYKEELGKISNDLTNTFKSALRQLKEGNNPAPIVEAVKQAHQKQMDSCKGYEEKMKEDWHSLMNKTFNEWYEWAINVTHSKLSGNSTTPTV